MFLRGVSSIRLRTLRDFMHHGMMVLVLCRSCGHSVELDPTGLTHLFLHRRWNLSLQSACARFACSKCRLKNCDIQPGRLVGQQLAGGPPARPNWRSKR